MGKPSSNDETTIRHQFDRFCQKVLHDEKVDYIRKQEHLKQHEITFDEVPGKELYKLLVFDEYEAEHEHFSLYGYDIAVKDTLLAEALKELSDRKRNVILLSYFMEMSDAAIARKMNLVRSTVHEHRTRSLELLKQIMEENKSECKK